MGIKCKIVRGKNNKIEVVEAPNGEASILYNNLLKEVNNQELALDLWTMPYTIGFNELYGDWQNEKTSLELDSNGEPTIKEVMKYSKLLRTNGKKLTNKHLFELSNNLFSLEINDIESLFNEVRDTFYKKGYFSIDKKSLEESSLYTPLEVLEILSNPSLQNNIKDFVERIESEYLRDNSTALNTLINTYYFQEEDLVIDTREVVGIGKYKALNPFIISKEIAEKLAAIKDREVFSKQVEEIPYPALVDKYKNDAVFADNMFNRYSNMSIVPSFKETETGLVQKTNIDTATTLKEVLKTDVSKQDFTDNLSILERLDDQIWEELSTEVKSVLKEIESNLVSFNLDVVGLSDMYDSKSREEVIEFLVTLDEFTERLNTSFVEASELESISSVLDSFLERDIKSDLDYITPSNENKDRTLVKLTPISSELDLFTKESLIRTTDGLFHKVNVIQDIQTLYNTVYDLVINDASLLPKEAYYPSSFSVENDLHLGKLKDVKNKELVIQDIKRYVQKQMGQYTEVVNTNNVDALEKMTIYKLLFKHPIVYKNQVNKNNFLTNILSFTGNSNYLKNDFINDFYQKMLQSKVENSEDYKQVFSNFKVDELGISLINNDLHTKQQLKLLLPNTSIFNDLKQYALLSKNPDLVDLFTYNTLTEQSFINKELDDIFYSNNVDQVPIYKGDYTKENGVVIVKNGLRDYIRLKEGLFKLVEHKGNLSFYVNVPVNQDSVYFNYDVKVGNISNLNLNKFNNMMETNTNDFVSTNNIYSKKELEIINKEMDECR